MLLSRERRRKVTLTQIACATGEDLPVRAIGQTEARTGAGLVAGAVATKVDNGRET